MAGRTIKPVEISRTGVDVVKKHTETLLSEAMDLVNGVDHVLANTQSQYDLSAKNCYDFAEKLERASHLLLVIGDRKHQAELNKISLDDMEIF